MRKCNDFVSVNALHSLGSNHGLDHGFRGSLYGSKKNRIERMGRAPAKPMPSVGADRAWISGGESEEDVSGAVTRVTAVAAKAERNFLGYALELGWDERSVGGDNDDNRSRVFSVGGMLGNFLAHGNAGDAELIAATIIALHENADGIASSLSVEHMRRSPDTAVKLVL